MNLIVQCTWQVTKCKIVNRDDFRNDGGLYIQNFSMTYEAWVLFLVFSSFPSTRKSNLWSCNVTLILFSCLSKFHLAGDIKHTFPKLANTSHTFELTGWVIRWETTGNRNFDVQEVMTFSLVKQNRPGIEWSINALTRKKENEMESYFTSATCDDFSF